MGRAAHRGAVPFLLLRCVMGPARPGWMGWLGGVGSSDLFGSLVERKKEGTGGWTEGEAVFLIFSPSLGRFVR